MHRAPLLCSSSFSPPWGTLGHSFRETGKRTIKTRLKSSTKSSAETGSEGWRGFLEYNTVAWKRGGKGNSARCWMIPCLLGEPSFRERCKWWVEMERTRFFFLHFGAKKNQCPLWPQKQLGWSQGHGLSWAWARLVPSVNDQTRKSEAGSQTNK